ncbi:MAG TPA: aminotransferase class IV [Pirellulaceae bacterium]|nr:aminotransferase class IV [Pirellulaceae bacterium]
MTERLAFLDGKFVPDAQLSISVDDGGFMQGVTVAEQMRTFAGRLFRVEEHIRRLQRSLDIVGFKSPVPLAKLQEQAQELVDRNRKELDAADDWNLQLFVTPGKYKPHGGSPEPIVAMLTRPLPFRDLASLYKEGQPLAISTVRQVPPDCWPPELKCRSRMHYYLADREVRSRDSKSRALLLDQDGYLSEATTANVVLYRRDTGFLSPKREKILPGISVAALRDLAEQVDVAFQEADIAPESIYEADEVFLCSTSPCLIPCTSCDGRPIGSGKPGPAFDHFLALWSETVGVDIREQAVRFADRAAKPAKA